MSTHQKIKTPQALKKILLPRKKKKVVFTNGCFDLLHVGHVQYLQKAKKLGDILVLALNSDASVQKIKGPNRPLVPFKQRAEIMAALECVDFVTSFSQPTPFNLIQFLKPHILVKGGDWKIKDIVGATTVLQNGGKVKTIRYLSGKSTTNLIQTILKKYGTA
ncbi:MAG: hypothetical protein A3B70_07215 [Deltaproteobacteria bacterium RIFCSPHIGHO2_02_FULL_40_11]|nr:MAG: hypothetical protein A3B70_07215 [Deltaproteobacteria bacterium RIFCSPHIGHO2_02_FULL_40_11]